MLHVFGPLAAFVLAQGWLDRLEALRRRPWLVVILAGLLGTLLLAPEGLGLEGLFGME